MSKRLDPEKEAEIVRYIQDGYGVLDIKEELHVSSNTVSRIRAKYKLADKKFYTCSDADKDEYEIAELRKKLPSFASEWDAARKTIINKVEWCKDCTPDARRLTLRGFI